MKLFSGTMILAAFVLVGCSSTKKAPPEKKIEVEKPSYVVLQSSQATYPNWIIDPELGDEPSERNNYRYFTDNSENGNQRLCVRSAQARATSKIAREISQFLKNSYTEATQNTDGDESAETYMEERLAQEAQAFIVGARNHKTFWQRLEYKKDLGADADKKVFECHALIKMNKSDLEKAVRNAKAKLLSNIKNPEVKQKAQKNLISAEKEFSDFKNTTPASAEEI